jgi:hypothetical protein
MLDSQQDSQMGLQDMRAAERIAQSDLSLE